MILLGQVFGELTVIEDLGRLPKSHRRFKCRCSCGNVAIKYETNLLYGRTTDCNNCRWYDKYPKLYKVWQSMLGRCRSESHAAYKDYGGRGITVCARWYSFQPFLEDMGVPAEGLSLDRINNNLGYCKDNCRWATKSEQAFNRRPKSVKDLATLSSTSKRAIAARNLLAEQNWIKSREKG